MQRRKIEFLSFKGCPGYKPALSLLEQVLFEKGTAVLIEKIEIASQGSAKQGPKKRRSLIETPFVF